VAEDGVPTVLLMAKSRHASLRTLQRYARPGVESVARLTVTPPSKTLLGTVEHPQMPDPPSPGLRIAVVALGGRASSVWRVWGARTRTTCISPLDGLVHQGEPPSVRTPSTPCRRQPPTPTTSTAASSRCSRLSSRSAVSRSRTNGSDSEDSVDETDHLLGKYLTGASTGLLDTLRQAGTSLMSRRLARAQG